MLTSSMDALSYSLCFDTTSLAHRDAVGGERLWPGFHLTESAFQIDGSYLTTCTDTLA